MGIHFAIRDTKNHRVVYRVTIPHCVNRILWTHGCAACDLNGQNSLDIQDMTSTAQTLLSKEGPVHKPEMCTQCPCYMHREATPAELRYVALQEIQQLAHLTTVYPAGQWNVEVSPN